MHDIPFKTLPEIDEEGLIKYYGDVYLTGYALDKDGNLMYHTIFNKKEHCMIIIFYDENAIQFDFKDNYNSLPGLKSDILSLKNVEDKETKKFYDITGFFDCEVYEHLRCVIEKELKNLNIYQCYKNNNPDIYYNHNNDLIFKHYKYIMNIIPKRNSHFYMRNDDYYDLIKSITPPEYIPYYTRLNKLFHYMKNKNFIQCYTSSSESGKIIMKYPVSILKKDYSYCFSNKGRIYDDKTTYSNIINYYFYDIHSKYYDRNDICFKIFNYKREFIEIVVKTCNTFIELRKDGNKYKYLEGDYFKLHKDKIFFSLIHHIDNLYHKDPDALYLKYKKLKKQIKNIDTEALYLKYKKLKKSNKKLKNQIKNIINQFNEISNSRMITHNIQEHDLE